MWFRAIIALIASTYILIHGHDLNLIIRAFKGDPNFYLALLISYLITLLLVYLIHWTTVKLDSKHDWRKNTYERIFWQSLFAVILPILIDLGLMSIYSAFLGEVFIESRFLLVDFPIIVSFIILLNMYYVIHYLIKTEPKSVVEDGKNVEADESPNILTIDYDHAFIQLYPTDILCFYRSGNLIKVVTNQKEYTTKGSLSLNALEIQYFNDGFLRINRGVIINMKTVKGFYPINNLRLNVIFHEPITVKDSQTDLFIVTGKYIRQFKGKLQSK
jgi:LytTr DNA-binding domain